MTAGGYTITLRGMIAYHLAKLDLAEEKRDQIVEAIYADVEKIMGAAWHVSGRIGLAMGRSEDLSKVVNDLAHEPGNKEAFFIFRDLGFLEKKPEAKPKEGLT